MGLKVRLTTLSPCEGAAGLPVGDRLRIEGYSAAAIDKKLDFCAPAGTQRCAGECPACKKPVRKVWSTFNSPRTLSISDAKKAGFSVLKRVNKGEYERQ